MNTWLRQLQVMFDGHPLIVAAIELGVGMVGLSFFVFCFMRALSNLSRWIGW